MTNEHFIARDLARYREFTAAAARGDSYADLNARAYAERLRRLGVTSSMLDAPAAPRPAAVKPVTTIAETVPVDASAKSVTGASPDAQAARLDAELSNYFPGHRDFSGHRLESNGSDAQSEEAARLACGVTAFLPAHRRHDQRVVSATASKPIDEADRLASEVTSHLPAHRRG